MPYVCVPILLPDHLITACPYWKILLWFVWLIIWRSPCTGFWPCGSNISIVCMYAYDMWRCALPVHVSRSPWTCQSKQAGRTGQREGGIRVISGVWVDHRWEGNDGMGMFLYPERRPPQLPPILGCSSRLLALLHWIGTLVCQEIIEPVKILAESLGQTTLIYFKYLVTALSMLQATK